MNKSIIGFLSGFAAPWWLYEFALVPSVLNAGAAAICLAGMLYFKLKTSAPVQS